MSALPQLGAALRQPQAQPTDPWSRFMMAFLQGQQIKMQREAFQSEQESRKLERDRIKAAIKHDELVDKQNQTKGGFDIAQMLMGIPNMVTQPEQQFGFTPQQEQPGPETMLRSLGIGGPAPASTPMPMQPQTVTTPEVSYDKGFHEVNIPGLGPLRVPSRGGVFEQQLREKDLLGQIEAIAAGRKKGAEAAAEAPYNEIDIPGMGTVNKAIAPAVVAERGAGLRSQAEIASREKVAGAQNRTTLTAANIQAAATREARVKQSEDKLTDDFHRDVKDFLIADDQINRLREFSKLGTGPADIGLLYSYMKMLDPSSTVREGEYATAQNTGSVPNRIWAAYNKTLAGERLSPPQRAEFVAAAEKGYDAIQPRRQKIEQQYQGRAKRLGVDPGLFGKPSAGTGPRLQFNPATGTYRHSLDGGKTWLAGKP